MKTGEPVSDQEVGRHLFKEACAYIGEYPGMWLKLMAVKLRYYFSEPGVRLNIDAYGAWERSALLRKLPFSFAFLVAAGLTGLLIAVFRRNSAGLVALVAFVVWSISILLFFVTDQYRQVAAPLLAAGSGMGVFHGADFLLRKRWIQGAGVIAGFVLLMFLAGRNWNNYQPDRVFHLLNDASALTAAGKPDEAGRIYAQIIEMPLQVAAAWREGRERG